MKQNKMSKMRFFTLSQLLCSPIIDFFLHNPAQKIVDDHFYMRDVFVCSRDHLKNRMFYVSVIVWSPKTKPSGVTCHCFTQGFGEASKCTRFPI